MSEETKKKIEKAYKSEHKKLLSWVKAKVGSDYAEDVVHDVFVRACTNLDSLEPIRDIASWLWRSVRNGVIDIWRSRARSRTVAHSSYYELDTIVDPIFNSVSNEYEQKILLDALYNAIEQLPIEQKNVIIAQTIQGETFESISKRTGVSIETLSARKRYAILKIEMALQSYY